MATEIKGLKISQIPEVTKLTGNEMIPCEYGGTNGKFNASKLANYITENLDPYDPDGKLAQLENKVNNISGDVNNLETNITNLGSDLDGLESKVNQNTTNISNNTTKITNNTNSISDLNDSIGNLDQRVTKNTNDIANIKIATGDVSDITDELNKLKTRVSTNETNISSNTTDISEANTQIETLGDVCDGLNTEITNIKNSKGAAGGLASLGSDGKVPSSQLPNLGGDSKQEVFMYTSQSSFPTSSIDQAALYIAKDDNKVYRYSGSTWVEVSPSVESDPDVKFYSSRKVFPSEGDANTLYVDKDFNKIYRWATDDYELLSDPGAVAEVGFYDGVSDFPTTGDTGKIYVDKVTNKIYRWTGVVYTELSQQTTANIPDNEDLVAEENVLKFANKSYDVLTFSGIGRVFLRKNIVNGNNVLTQEMINLPNTRYIIQYDYDLNNQTITMQDGCVLDFQGGSLQNGEIVGVNTCIDSSINRIFYNITLNGSYNIPEIFPQWFGANGDGVTDDTDAITNAINTGIRVRLFKGKYKISSPLIIKDGGLFGSSPKSTFILPNFSGNAIQISKDYVTDNRSSVVLKGFTITGNTDYLNSSVGIKFIDTTSNQYIKGVLIEDVELNDLGRGIYLSQCFRVNVNRIGMTKVINPIKIVGSIVQCSFTNITCNLDYTGATEITKSGIEATDTQNAIESALFSKCSFVGYDYGVYFTAPTLITNFEYMDLDFCQKIGMVLGNNCFNVLNSWICISGESTEAGIQLKTNNQAFIYPITIKGCTFMSDVTTSTSYFIHKEGSSDYNNRLIICDNLYRAYTNKLAGGIIYAENLTNLYLCNNVLADVANKYYSVNIKTSYGSIIIENNTVNGRLYLSTSAGVFSRYVVTNNNTSQIELFNNAIESGNGSVEFLVDRNSGTIIANNKVVSSSKYGTTSNRSDAPYIGFRYFDTTLNKPLWWSGSSWVDADGAVNAQ